MAGIELTLHWQSWPLKSPFRISRSTVHSVETLIVELTRGTATGRGECRPYARYGETRESVAQQIEAQRSALHDGLTRAQLQARLPAGAARNALDCALWDLEAKESHKRVWRLAHLDEPEPLLTAYTISLDSPQNMSKAAAAAADRPVIKVKLGGGDGWDGPRMRAVRHGAPQARLIVDANEGWKTEEIGGLMAIMAECKAEMVEQPLPAGQDGPLAELDTLVPICADESCHDLSSLPGLAGLYDMVNVKLDKTGGLTEALELMRQARAAGYDVMVGCMLASSLATAPAFLAGTHADLVDLDGPLLLAVDAEPPLEADGSFLQPPDPKLWG